MEIIRGNNPKPEPEIKKGKIMENLSDEEIERIIKEKDSHFLFSGILFIGAIILAIIRPDFIYKNEKIWRYLIWVAPLLIGSVAYLKIHKYEDEKNRRLKNRWKAEKDCL